VANLTCYWEFSACDKRVERGIETVMTKNKINWGKTPWKISFRAEEKALPEHVDFVVVGGGFTGLTAAAWLARGKSVLLLDAGQLGNGASGRTGGMALAQTAAGDLPGLGDVLRGYRNILKRLRVNADLELPGVWEIARGDRSMEGKAIRPLQRSPIDWSDSGRVRAVGKVSGGTVDPGKVVSGLARAAVKGGAQIVEGSEVVKIEFADPLRLHVRPRYYGGRVSEKIVTAGKVLLATNAGSLDLAEELFAGKVPAEPKLTFAIATAPLTKKQLADIGMASNRPFYSVDIPYLWGRLLRSNRIIFGSGLVPAFGESLRGEGMARKSADSRLKKLWSGLEEFIIRSGQAAERIRTLENRVRQLHPALKNVRITHRWGGPILLTKDFVPVFRCHPKSENVIVLGGYSGHGVALSVYLGRWAAEVLDGWRSMPNWARQ
jgi:gamma-glutamylputrescine oxidase